MAAERKLPVLDREDAGRIATIVSELVLLVEDDSNDLSAGDIEFLRSLCGRAWTGDAAAAARMIFSLAGEVFLPAGRIADLGAVDLIATVLAGDPEFATLKLEEANGVSRALVHHFRTLGPPVPNRQTCRECGCTNERACRRPITDPIRRALGQLERRCRWLEPDLCSACGPGAEAGWIHPPRTGGQR